MPLSSPFIVVVDVIVGAMSCFSCCFNEADQQVQVINLTGEDPHKPGAKPVLTPDSHAEHTIALEPKVREVEEFIEYAVAITKRADEKIGLLLDMLDRRTAQVCEIGPGCIREYNRTASPHNEVKVGHFLVSVNGTHGDASAFVEMFKKETQIDLVFRLANEYPVTLCIDNLAIGIVFMHAPRGISLLVTEVKQGAIMKWNDAHPDKRVRVWDRLIGVNGNRGLPVELLKQIQELDTCESVDLVFATVFDD